MVCSICKTDMAIIVKDGIEIFQCFNCNHEEKKDK